MVPSALVLKLRKQPEVRDAEALAAWIGRYKKLRKAGVSNKKAMKLAGKQGGMKQGGVKAEDSGKREHRRDERKNPTAVAKELKKKILEDDDPFAEDYYDDPFAEDDDDDLTPAERRQQERYEAQVMKGFEDAEKGKLYNIFMEMGGLKTRDDLREEYREIPNTYKRKDGMAGDEMAEYLGMYYPEFGIESERDLIEFFAG